MTRDGGPRTTRRIEGKQGPFAGQGASAPPAITDAEPRTGEASGQGRPGLGAERNPGAPAPFGGPHTTQNSRVSALYVPTDAQPHEAPPGEHQEWPSIEAWQADPATTGTPNPRPSVAKPATLTVVVVFDGIPGRQIIADTLTFDASPEGFDLVWEKMRVAMHDRAESPLRPCGHPGPWHEFESVVEATEGSRASTQTFPAKGPVGTAALRPSSPLEADA